MRIWILATLLAAAAAQAGERIDERRTVSEDAVVRVYNVKGEVTVRTGEPGEVRLTGSLGEGSQGLEVSDGGRRLEIKVRFPRNANYVEDTELNLLVPETVSLEIETVSAEVRVDGVRGERLDVESVSGEIEVVADPKRVNLKSVSGDLALRTRSERIELETVSGDIEGEELSGELSVNTVSGEALIATRALRRGRFETVSGDLELNLHMSSDADVSIASLSGDVDLDLPDELSADVEVTAFSGSIRSDRGEVKTARYGPQKSLSFRAGDGVGRIRIESFSGDVRIQSR